MSTLPPVIIVGIAIILSLLFFNFTIVGTREGTIIAAFLSFKDFKLENVSFDLPRGCILGLIGENGAGKTTTIKLILDILDLDDLAENQIIFDKTTKAFYKYVSGTFVGQTKESSPNYIAFALDLRTNLNNYIDEDYYEFLLLILF